jgi:hypothetical protein
LNELDGAQPGKVHRLRSTTSAFTSRQFFKGYNEEKGFFLRSFTRACTIKIFNALIHFVTY